MQFLSTTVKSLKGCESTSAKSAVRLGRPTSCLSHMSTNDKVTYVNVRSKPGEETSKYWKVTKCMLHQSEYSHIDYNNVI